MRFNRAHFDFFFAAFLVFGGAAALAFFFFAPFVADLGAFFFVAFGPIPTQLSTVSTTFLILLFFFAIYHSLNGKSYYTPP